MAAVADPRGLKRICLSCGTRFYDLNKRPVICPNCKAEFKGEVKVKARRGRVAAANDDDLAPALAKAAPAEDIEASADDETVSLEDVAAEDDADDEDIDDDGPDLDITPDIPELEDLDDDADDDEDDTEDDEDEDDED